MAFKNILSIGPDRALLIATVWFIFPFIILGKYSFIYTQDTLEIFVTHLVNLGNQGFDSGLWNPSSSSGTDTVALGFNGAAYRAVFAVLPGWLAYQFFIVIQTVAAILGSFYLCRRVLNLSKAASLFPAVIFGLMLPGQFIYSVFSFLPILILSLSSLLDKRKSSSAWFFAIISILWVSGTAYISWLVPFSSALLISWFLIVERRRQWHEWSIITGAAIALFALRYEDIQALAQIAPYAHINLLRQLPTYDDVLTWPFLLTGYVNLLCAGMFLFSWLATETKSELMQGMALFLFLGLFAQPFAFLTQIYLAETFPFIQGFSVTKISEMITAVLWLSSAFAVEPIIKGLQDSGLRRAIALLLTVCASLVVVHQGVVQKKEQFYGWASQGNYVHNLESSVIEEVAVQANKQFIPERAEMFQVYSSYLQPYGLETAGGYEALYMRRYYDFWSTVLEPMGRGALGRRWPSMSNEWPYFRPTRLILTTDKHQAEHRFSDLYRLNLLSMANVTWILSRDKLTDPELSLVYGDFKPWSSLSQFEKFKVNLRANFFGREHLFVYKNEESLPRFISPSRVKVHDNGQAVLRSMAESTIEELSNTLFISKADLPTKLDAEVIYPELDIKPVHYKNDKIELSIDAVKDGILVGLNAWSPFWTVEIDGQPAQMFPANHAFWGVVMPRGKHRVVFRYKRF